MERKSIIENAKKVVIKVGTNALSKSDGTLDDASIGQYANSISKIQKSGKKIIIVSSGAIAAGISVLKLKDKPRNIELKQACAAIGQNKMISAWSKSFDKYNIHVAQLLLTYDVFTNRALYLNLMKTLNKLISLNIIPIINENDVISISEIGASFGDNDKLSALVAAKIQADLLILVSDVDGVYNQNPKTHSDAELIEKIYDITPDIKKACGGKGSTTATGGMETKLNAAKIASESGIAMIIVNGKTKNIIDKIFNFEKVGTIFIPKNKLSNKRSWIKLAKSSGVVIVDEGAKKAILSGKNLLSAGVKKVSGEFNVNDVVEIIENNRVFAKAIVDYSKSDLSKIIGKNSSDVTKILGSKARVNVFRRENLVLL